MLMLLFSFLLLGLVLGSFVNAWVLRLHDGKSIADGRSECHKCKMQLAWYDNIPLVSFAMLKGKCRHCCKPISWQYPAIEFATAILFGLLYVHFQPANLLNWIVLMLWCIVSVFMVAAFVYDLMWMELPDRFMLPVIGIASVLILIGAYQSGWSSMVPQLIATAIFTGIYLALWLFSQGRFLGGGDIRLAAAMGLLLTVPQLLVGVFVAYLLGAGIGVFLIVTKQKKRTSKVPLAPFLIIGLYFGLFWGIQIANWYLKFF